MTAPDEYGQLGSTDDDLDELDLTEDEFDARMARGEPVLVIGFAARPLLRERVEDYYTLQVSDSSTVPTSAGRWGGGPLPDPLAQVASLA
jgi:hypothetical protein